MDIKSALESQYLASLEMFRRAVAACPPDAWDDPKDKNRFWRVGYHALWFTDFYLSRSQEEYTPWEGHVEEHQFLGSMPWEGNRMPKTGTPYTPEQLLEYCDLCSKRVGAKLAQIELDAPSGFEWLPFNKFELQIYNIRHIQHHAAQLIARIRQRAGVEIDWVGRGVNVPPR